MKLNCPKCGAEWHTTQLGRPSEGGGIVEETCECFVCDAPDYLYSRYMKDTGQKRAIGLMHARVSTPFGIFRVGSLHPFGVSVSKTGYGDLLGFSWTLTGDWQVLTET